MRGILERDEVNSELNKIIEMERSGIVYLFERMCIVNQSKIHQWWYVHIPILQYFELFEIDGFGCVVR